MEQDDERGFTESFEEGQDVSGDGLGYNQQTDVPNNLVHNQPYDESVEISDPEEVPSNNPTPRDQEYYSMGSYTDGNVVEPEIHPQNLMAMDVPDNGATRIQDKHGNGTHLPNSGKLTAVSKGSEGGGTHEIRGGGAGKKRGGGRGANGSGNAGLGGAGKNGATYNPEDEDEEEDSEQEDHEQSESEETEESEPIVAPVVGVYDPAEYAQLPVSKEIKDLFKHITRYKPQVVHLDTKLKPFIPELIPAIGDIDAFLKVQRPGERPENLGLNCLDEPKVKQSDPTLLDLTLRTLSKQTTVKPMTVRSIDDPEKQVKDMDAWTTSISELHRQKPATTVHYSRNMPDIENLMQEWPAKFQESLKEVEFLPNADLSCDLKDFADIVCALSDIPVYKSRVQALHVFFSLYLEFKDSQHFQTSGGDAEGLSTVS